jgi:hypothetical protein
MKGQLVVDPVIRRRTDLQPARLLVIALLAVAAFALVISFVSATAWRIDADLKFLAAIGGTMLNLVTGAIIYFAVRLRPTSAASRLGVLDEDLAGGDVQDRARTAEDQHHERQLE